MTDPTEVLEAEPSYEETVLSSDLGTVTFRDYGCGNVWLGLREGNEPQSPPKVFIQLSERQQRTLSALFIDCRRDLQGSKIRSPKVE